MSLTGNVDTDRIVLSKLNDKDLFNAIQINKYINKTVANETFFLNRLMEKYPFAIKYKQTSWKTHYMKIIYYLNKINNEFLHFRFTRGDPEFYYNTLVKIHNEDKFLGVDLLKKGHDDLALYCLKMIRL
jgi:hypothetical protein